MRFSLRISLDETISSDEKKILENIKYCSRIVGKSFKVILWNENISESDVKKFINRNQEMLFELNTKITKKSFPEHVWFLVNSTGDKCKATYTFSGSVLNGIASYIKTIKHFKRIEKDNESSYSR